MLRRAWSRASVAAMSPMLSIMLFTWVIIVLVMLVVWEVSFEDSLRRIESVVERHWFMLSVDPVVGFRLASE